ncbi:hypothetical protein FCULG_00006624 [Fusarium culmorum]|uniref:Uncharacterized protein n=1 Tax=Fusarium culmorum TaxID=5516 RepID=A0A2T4GVF4_FUSCU|nr:hypothetical protein FCULG_00006624 [Fusarium culmorum]
MPCNAPSQMNNSNTPSFPDLLLPFGSSKSVTAYHVSHNSYCIFVFDPAITTTTTTTTTITITTTAAAAAAATVENARPCALFGSPEAPPGEVPGSFKARSSRRGGVEVSGGFPGDGEPHVAIDDAAAAAPSLPPPTTPPRKRRRGLRGRAIVLFSP